MNQNPNEIVTWEELEKCKSETHNIGVDIWRLTNTKCYKCNTLIKKGYEWCYHYYYCPSCKEDRTEKGNKC